MAASGRRRISWLFFKARAKRPSRTIFILLLFGSFPVSVKWCGMRPLTASPARAASPAAHFERNDVTIIWETVHWSRTRTAERCERHDIGILIRTCRCANISLPACKCYSVLLCGQVQKKKRLHRKGRAFQDCGIDKGYSKDPPACCPLTSSN